MTEDKVNNILNKHFFKMCGVKVNSDQNWDSINLFKKVKNRNKNTLKKL